MPTHKKYNDFRFVEDDILQMKLNNTEDWVYLDRSDLLKVKLYTWSLYTIKKYKYIVTTINGKEANKLALSRYLMKAPLNRQVRVIDGNFLDCRKQNLMIVE